MDLLLTSGLVNTAQTYVWLFETVLNIMHQDVQRLHGVVKTLKSQIRRVFINKMQMNKMQCVVFMHF